MKKGKKVTLQEVGEMLGFVVEHMVTKEELTEGLGSLRAELKRDLASKEDLMSLQMQVNSIEAQIRGMNNTRLEARVADLEDKVFGRTRS